MKRFIEATAIVRNLPLFGHRPVLQCLGFEISDPTHGLTDSAIDGIWTKALNDADSERSEFIETSIELRGLVADYFNRPELDRSIGSGTHLAVRLT